MFPIKLHGHLIIGLISLLLTLTFLGYFICKEYQDEKAAMVLEKRDEIFVQVFAKVEGEMLGVRSDTIQSGLSSSFGFSEFENFESISGSPTVSLIISDSLNGHFLDTTFTSTVDHPHSLNSLESIVKVIGGSYNELSHKADFDSVLSESISSKNELAKDISTITVIKRIIPQILISLLVLLSILMTYLLFLRQLKKERKLSQMRNDLMSNMSHELKTPVSTISVALEALRSFNASDNRERSAEYIDISMHETKRLGLLVDKALNISLFEQGKFIADKQTIDLHSEIQSIVKTLKVQLDVSKVQLNYNIIGTQFLVNVDKTHIINVIHNLIENAIKYTKKPPIINIELQERDENITMSISDNGIGIPSEYQGKIYDKFFRVPQGNAHNVKGHGLGLSYVKEVISKHNGTIALKSQENIGSTFIISLPKADCING